MAVIKSGIRWVGIDQANANIRVFGQRSTAAARMVVHQATKAVEAEAKRLAVRSSGKLQDGITSIFSEKGLSGTVISVAAHTQVVEFGSRPHPQSTHPGAGREMPPIPAIMDWMRHSGISPRKGTLKGAAFLIARHIRDFGIPPNPFMRPAFDKYAPKAVDNMKVQILAAVPVAKQPYAARRL